MIHIRVLKIIVFLVLSQIVYSQSSPKDGWSIKAINSENYTGISIANGRIGILPSSNPFEVQSIILNNVYEKESELGVSKIVSGHNFLDLKLMVDGEMISKENITNWSQTLNMKEASLTTRFSFKNKLDVSYTFYALRNLPYVVLNDVIIEAKKEVALKVINGISTSIEFKDDLSTYRVLKDLETYMPILQTVSKTKFNKHTIAASSTIIFNGEKQKLSHEIIDNKNHNVSFEKKLNKKEFLNFTLAGAICSTQDFEDPQSESERFVIYTMLNDIKSLVEKHKNDWETLWKGDIIIEGDLETQLDVRLALYHLYAFSREDSNLSIPPMGLSSTGYNGHIFWDAELWMYPPLLVFNQDIAKSMLNYRFNRLKEAKERAKNYGFKGAMYPWESDDTGEEATPTWALTGTFEHHVTADVGIAFWNYFRITRDKVWLKEKGFPVLKEVADFWVSRAEQNSDTSYSIKNVVGANEFAHNVTDNAFTNGAAKTALNYAVKAGEILNIEASNNWQNIADKLVIHKSEKGFTKEHNAYNGEIIKQVDVNLLAYPLQIITDKNQIEKDLKYYELKLAPEGPAMSHSILSILHVRLGNIEKSYELFQKAYQPNKRMPFGALSESALSNNPYFATAAGGILQTVIFGFAGLHFTDEGLIQKNPKIPQHWKKLTLKGVGINNETFIITH
jgi:trehalose/maltose hydrolase-like predicted phosphorylase